MIKNIFDFIFLRSFTLKENIILTVWKIVYLYVYFITKSFNLNFNTRANLNKILYYKHPTKVYFSNLIYFIRKGTEDLSIINPLYEIHNYHILNKIIKDNFIIIDIGAHIGKYSIYLAKKKKIKIIAIEPEERSFSILQQNIKINKLKNVILIKCAAWNENREIKLKLTGTVARHFVTEKNKGIKVKGRKIDSIINQLEIKKVNLIKIDVEDKEIEVLEGSINTLKKFKPFLLIEVWNYNGINKILNDLNYKLIKIKHPYYLAYFIKSKI